MIHKLIRSEAPTSEHRGEWLFVMECGYCGRRVNCYISENTVAELAASKRIGYLSDRAVEADLQHALAQCCEPKLLPGPPLLELSYAQA